MTHLPFTITAYFLNSISVLIDKFMVTKHIPNPLIYVFYLSLVSLVMMFGLPFTHVPSMEVFIYASISTILWTTGWYYMFKGLQVGIASRVIPVIGTLIPLILLAEATLISKEIASQQTLAVVILILGLIFLTIQDWQGKISKKEIIFELLSAFLFAISYLFLKEAYLRENFLTVLVYSRVILVPIGIALFAFPVTRRIVLNKSQQGPDFNWISKLGLLFLAGQASGAGSELLLTFSVSLASPALVNSLQGVQYVFLFSFGMILSKKHPEVFKEHSTTLGYIAKTIGIILIGIGLYILAFSSPPAGGSELNSKTHPNLKFGVTFSTSYATYLDLDWQKSYDLILNDLKVKRLRLPTYWREVESKDNQYNFQDTDYLLNQAEKANAEVLLVIGMKQPRWPECQIPDWARKLTVNQRQEQVLNLVETVVTRYKNHPSIWAWQVENEPLFSFGENCDAPDSQFLQQEVELVKKLDPQRPIVITDTGEWKFWITPMQLSNILGISVYRYANIEGYGFLHYPFPKLYYKAKSEIIRRFFAPNNQKTIITELQTEAWSTKSLKDTKVDEQIRLLSLKQFKDNINFAKNTGFDEIYLWGVEWWIYLAKYNHPEYLEYVRGLF